MRANMKWLSLLALAAAGCATMGSPGEHAVIRAKNKVIPSLVHIRPVKETFASGQKQEYVVEGSGFIISPDGYVVTNEHVAGDSSLVRCVLYNKDEIDAEVVGTDRYTDIAVLKLKSSETNLPAAELGNSAHIEPGQTVLALGSPHGLSRSISKGIVSVTDRYLGEEGPRPAPYNTWIQTDAAINPGNSGGPLLNIAGEVIGINSAITSTSGGNIGIGFAIPVNLAKRVMEDLVANGKVTRAYIGISPQEITSDLMEAFNLEEVSGVLVAKVETDSPAHRAGLEVGDVIVEFNSEKVPNVSKFRIAVATSKVGTRVPVKIIRENKERTLYIQLDSYPEDGSVASADSPANNGSVGITVEARDSAYAKRNNINVDKGVIISTIEGNSAASKAGLQVGYVILKVGREAVETPDEYSSAISKAMEKMKKDNRKTITLYVMDRNKNEQFVVLRFD